MSIYAGRDIRAGESDVDRHAAEAALMITFSSKL